MITSEQALRRMRQKIFDYHENKEEQAHRVILYLKKRMLRYRDTQEQKTGIYSGLTRSELNKTGTCETDWY